MRLSRGRGKRVARSPRWLAAAVLVVILGTAALLRADPGPRVLGPLRGSEAGSLSAPAATAAARVEAAVDGDTVRLATGERVRYIGIDAPELAGEHGPDHAYAREALERNRQLVEGRTVQLERDVDDQDRFGRLLRYVWVDGALVQERLIREGLAYALVIPPNTRYGQRLEQAQAEARAEGRGVWSDWPRGPALFLTPLPTSAPLPSPKGGACPSEALPPEQAGRQAGRPAVVCLRVVRTQRSAAAVRLRPGSGARFSVVLFEPLWGRFPVAPERYFEGGTVVARGRVELYDGAPELVVRDIDDIRLVR